MCSCEMIITELEWWVSKHKDTQIVGVICFEFDDAPDCLLVKKLWLYLSDIMYT